MSKYSVQVFWSDDDEGYIAVCPELGQVSAFGETYAEAATEIETVIELALEAYKYKGWKIPDPQHVPEFSGQFRLRLAKSTHARLTFRARAESTSLNSLVAAYVERGLASDDCADGVRTVFAEVAGRAALYTQWAYNSAIHSSSPKIVDGWEMPMGTVAMVGSGDLVGIGVPARRGDVPLATGSEQTRLVP